MICTRLPAVYDAGARRGGADARTRSASPTTYRYTGSTQFLVGQFDFTRAGRRRVLTAAARRGGRRRLRRLDGGLRRVHAARRACPPTASTGAADAQPLRDALPPRRRTSSRDRAPRPLARFNRSGWTGTARALADRLGRRPDDRLGLRRPRVRVRNGADDGPVRRVALGLGHRRLLHARRRRSSTPELLTRWIQFGVRVGRDAHRRPTASSLGDKGRARRSSTPTCCRSGAATRSCARSSTRTSRRRRREYERSGPADHAPPRAGRIPDDAARDARATTSTCSGPTCWPRRCSSRARRRATLYLPRGRWIDLWRSARLDAATASLRLGARAACCAAARERDAAGAARRAAAARARRARSCRCCRPTSRRSPTTARATRTSSRSPSDISQFRLLVFPRGRSARRVGSARWVSAEGKDRWTLVDDRRRTAQALRGAGVDGFAGAAVQAGVRDAWRQAARTPAWSYDAKRRVLRARFAGRGTLRLVAVRKACEIAPNERFRVVVTAVAVLARRRRLRRLRESTVKKSDVEEPGPAVLRQRRQAAGAARSSRTSSAPTSSRPRRARPRAARPRARRDAWHHRQGRDRRRRHRPALLQGRRQAEPVRRRR